VSTLTQKLLGLFGRGNKTATHTHQSSPAHHIANSDYSEVATFAQTMMEQLLTMAKMPCKVSVYEDTEDMLSLEIENTEDTGRIIGKNGNTLEAFQILLKAFIQRKFSKRISLIIDTNQYRKRYEEKLEQNARKLAQRVLTDQKTYRMRPMPAQDRRAVHRLFENDPLIVSHSTGQGDYRYVSLSLKNS
jgi:spoIIIJ-associated protein